MRRSKVERFEVVMVVIMDTIVFWDVAIYSLLKFTIILE
jgi:hypothetical protein